MLGRFGRVYLESLEESRPEEFRRLKVQGQLNAMASREEERGQLLFAYHRAALLREQLAPKGYIGRVQYLQGIENRATELMPEDIVVRPDSDWIADYNAIAPHSSLGYRSPQQYRTEVLELV